MSFGFGVGDIFAISRLAWTVYKSCKSAPESFGQSSADVHSLKAVLDEAEEVITARPLATSQQERLDVILGSCHGILTELHGLVDKYHSLGTQSKRTWDRCQWYTEDITNIRSRIVAQVGMLDALLSASQVRVEVKLDQLIKEVREGKRGGSAVSVQTFESLSLDEKQAWRKIRKELEDVGITIAAFNANKDFIVQKISDAVNSGMFEEQAPLESTATRSSLDRVGEISESGGDASDGAIEQHVDSTALPVSNNSQQASEAFVGAKGEDLSSVSPQQSRPQSAKLLHDQETRTKASPILKLFKAFQSPSPNPRSQLTSYAKSANLAGMDYILQHPIKSKSITKDDLGSILLDVVYYQDDYKKSVAEKLLQAGASPNSSMKGSFIANAPDWISTVLELAIWRDNANAVALLIEHGADFKNSSSSRPLPLHLSMWTQSNDCLDLLLKLGVDPNTVDDHGRTALHAAVYHQRYDRVSKLFDLGADPSAQDRSGDTALHLLAYAPKSREDDVKSAASILLANGAKTNICDRFGDTPVTLARALGRRTLAMQLEGKNND